ncbi:hypothetical protein LZC95_43460 [Pendulispora brunnea]|uniref:Ribbon-helix-helix protein CopG domain-containing protein n=1 Tax=Pendulispora brunnea TaxID=2905690 RepID=A0ABZ2K3L6_9BACT
MVRLTPEVRARVKRLATSAKSTEATILRELVEEALEVRERRRIEEMVAAMTDKDRALDRRILSLWEKAHG